MPIYINIGGLVAAGFDPTGCFLLTVSHSGRGVFEVGSWARVARDRALAYPKDGKAIGIGPIDGQSIAVTEKDYKSDELKLLTPNGAFELTYESGTLTVVQSSGAAA